MEAELKLVKLREKHLYKQACAMVDLLDSLATLSKLDDNLVQQLLVKQEQVALAKSQAMVSKSTIKLLCGNIN